MAITFEIVGRRIKDRRELIGLSQKDVADQMEAMDFKVSRETISKIESGTRTTNALEIKALGKILKIAPEVLLEDEKQADLVTLFRNQGGVLTEAGEAELEGLQGFIRGLIAQEELYTGKRAIKRYTPSWR